MANLKSGNAMVRILLAHGEKIGMFAIVVCAGMLFWSALGSDQLGDDRQPEKLVQLANRANQHVLSFKWDEVDAEHKLHAQTVSGEAMAPVVREHFPPLPPMNRPVLDPVSLRTDPALLAVEDLEVHGDSGLWASADPDIIRKKQLAAYAEQQKLQLEENKARAKIRDDEEGGRGAYEDRGGSGLFGGARGVEGRTTQGARRDGPIVVSARSQAKLAGFEQISAKSWVTVLAKVPIKKQNQLYEDALLSSSGYDPGRDVPIYRGYIVERAEVTDEGESEWTRIASVNDKKLERTVETYPFDPIKLVSSRYTHPLLTHPLPPLVLRDWDQRVTHSSIPLISEEVPDDMPDEEETEDSDVPTGEDELFAQRDDERRDSGRRGTGRERFGPGGRSAGIGGQRMRGFGPGGGLGGGYGGEGEYGGEGGYGGEGMYGGEGEYGGRGRGGGSFRRGGAVAMYTWDGETDYVLFRYFDHKVLPGHRYRYRVRLALADVNDGVPEQYLDRTVTERRSKIKSEKLKTFIFTDWSKSSPVASVPLPARVYLASAETANEMNFNDEPEASILVKVFNSELPAEIAIETSFLRGSVLNVEDKASVIWADRANQDTDQWNKEFDFRTGITVVDFRGGRRLSSKNRDLTVPARAVMMDPAGRLFLQNELDDNEPVTEFQDVIEGGQDSRSPYSGRGEGFEGGPGEFGGEGGYGGYGER